MNPRQQSIQEVGGGSGGSTVISSGQFAYGTGTGITSSNVLMYDSALGATAIRMSDTNGATGLAFVTVPGTRLLLVQDPNGLDIVSVGTKATSRLTAFKDETGIPVFSINGLSSNRAITVNDTLNAIMLSTTTLAGTKKFKFGTGAGTADFVIDLVANTISNASPTGVWSLNLSNGIVNQPFLNTAALAAGTTQDVATWVTQQVFATCNAAGSTIGGIVAEANGTKKLLSVIGGALTINSSDVGSSPANRIVTTTGAPIVFPTGSIVKLIYVSQWVQY